MKIPAQHYRCPPRSQFHEGSGGIKRQGWRDQHILVVSERTSGGFRRARVRATAENACTEVRHE